MGRVDIELEQRLLNTTMTEVSCGPGYWLNMDTNACEKIQEEGPPRCEPGYWLNMDTNACEKIQDGVAG